MDLPYEAMRTFCEVARQRSFSRAGKTLLRSQSAVSLSVAKLEQVVGQRLLDRTTKRVTVTEAGEVLLKYLEQTEALLEQAELELQDLSGLEKGRLLLCTSDTTGCYQLPGLLQSFREKHPGIEIGIRNATSPRSIESVRNREVDLAIVTLRNLPPGIAATPLFPRKDVLICHPEHSLARRRRILLKDLESYPFILLDQNCSSRRLLDELCEHARVELNRIMELSSIEVIKRFVRIDEGLSIVPAMAVEEEVAAGQLASVDVIDMSRAKRRQMGVIHLESRYMSRAAQHFRAALAEHFGVRLT